MPYCPKCQAEYREGIARCAGCDVTLEAELPQGQAGKAEQLREVAGKGEAASLMRASYADACQMVEVLQANGVDAMVTGDGKSCDQSGTCSHYFVSVLPEDVADAGAVLRAEFQRLAVADGELKPDLDAMVDFDAEGTHTCPACGAHFEGHPETCPECELFLGVA